MLKHGELLDGYTLIINGAYGDRWLQCAWKNGKCIQYLPNHLVEKIRKKDPTLKIGSVRGDLKKHNAFMKRLRSE